MTDKNMKLEEQGTKDPEKSDTISTPLNPKYTFDLFVIGAGSQFAHAAAMSMASNLGEVYNPLLIYGDDGIGKSHLLNAIGHNIRQNSPDTSICYCSAESFMYEMVNHLRSMKMDIFRNFFRNLDVFLIDNIEFTSGKMGTQEELFQTFNALYDSHKQIVITCNQHPQEIPDLDERLRSRLKWGLIAEIQAPDLETKSAILKKKTEAMKIALPDDVIHHLVGIDTRNIRELEGMLITLDAYSRLQNIPITLEMARKCLHELSVKRS